MPFGLDLRDAVVGDELLPRVGSSVVGEPRFVPSSVRAMTMLTAPPTTSAKGPPGLPPRAQLQLTQLPGVSSLPQPTKQSP